MVGYDIVFDHQAPLTAPAGRRRRLLNLDSLKVEGGVDHPESSSGVEIFVLGSDTRQGDLLLLCIETGQPARRPPQAACVPPDEQTLAQHVPDYPDDVRLIHDPEWAGTTPQSPALATM